MGAVEVIAEALDDHRRGESNRDCIEGIGWVWACWCECGWHGPDRDHEGHASTEVLAALKAAGFVVATRDEIRAREGDAWDGALNEMHDLGWMHDGALADGFARNPYRELIDADVTRDHEEDER